MSLTHKQQLFVEHYLTCWNATDAAKRAGYSSKTAYSIGSENLTKPEIKAEIDRRLSEAAMSADEVLARLADHARSSLADFMTDEGALDLAKAREAGKLHLLKKIRWDKDGELAIELHDPQTALVHIGRYHALFVDKTALTDPSGKLPAPVIYLPGVVPAQEDDNHDV